MRETYLKKLWEKEYRMSWKRKVCFIKVKCICKKEYFMRSDAFKSRKSCWCVTLNESKKEILIWKKYNEIVPIKEVEKYISSSWKTKRRKFLCRCNKCWNNLEILADRIWIQKNCWCEKNIIHWFCRDTKKIKFYDRYKSIIERCNNPKHKWATHKEQMRNTRKNIIYKWQPLIIYCEKKLLNHRLVYKRIKELWWSIERAISE